MLTSSCVSRHISTTRLLLTTTCSSRRKSFRASHLMTKTKTSRIRCYLCHKNDKLSGISRLNPCEPPSTMKRISISYEKWQKGSMTSTLWRSTRISERAERARHRSLIAVIRLSKWRTLPWIRLNRPLQIINKLSSSSCKIYSCLCLRIKWSSHHINSNLMG